MRRSLHWMSPVRCCLSRLNSVPWPWLKFSSFLDFGFCLTVFVALCKLSKGYGTENHIPGHHVLWRASPPADHSTIGLWWHPRRTGLRSRSGQWDARLCRRGDRDGLMLLSSFHLCSPLDIWFSQSAMSYYLKELGFPTKICSRRLIPCLFGY